ncbi:MAG: glutamate synthase [Oscillospiraceae bacterium]|nr:glutamate synthase [Oscillospiraceae bacterium]
MTSICAEGLEHRELNEAIRGVDGPCRVEACCGQRFIAAGMSDKELVIKGVPGNALGAYLNGGKITVQGSAQDAVGDTMNAGTIVVHGNIGDAAGYAMRGGKIYVRGNAGYRAGIHMKAYKEKVPLMVIGGRAGSFLGEYQAGGVIVVLNLETPQEKCVGFFPCTGMHGGKMFLRSACENVTFPQQVTVRPADESDMTELRGYVSEYCELFGLDTEEVLSSQFTVVTPDSSNPYRQMYVAN